MKQTIAPEIKTLATVKAEISREIIRLQYVRDNGVMTIAKRNALQSLLEGLKLALLAFED